MENTEKKIKKTNKKPAAKAKATPKPVKKTRSSIPRTEKHAKDVMLLTSFGITAPEIAEYLDMSVDTLRKLYSREIAIANTNATHKVATRLYHKAVVQDDLKAQIFWLKTRARWSEKDQEQDDKNASLAERIIEKLMEKANIES